MGSESSAQADTPEDVAQSVIQFKEELKRSSEMSTREINSLAQAFASRPRVELVKPLELWSDQELEEEAERRQLSWLSLESDDELLAEIDRRDLRTRKASLTEEEFEREAKKRGYYASLAEFPLEEIQAYLSVQGGGGGGNNNNHGHKGGRSRKKRGKRRSHSRN